MSPRSQEFMAGAEERLAMARDLIATRHAAGAISAAYYAMLYAARAALSERDLHAKTHSGVWTLFSKELVASGQVSERLRRAAGRAQELREAGDYEAVVHDLDLAGATMADAEEFVASIQTMLSD